jgi:4-hydroxybenzoate polyprenyltransferase
VKGFEAEIRSASFWMFFIGGVVAHPSPVAARRLTSARGMLHLLRPHHWVKNILVLVPMLLAHLWGDPGVTRKALLAVVCFCLTASAGYIINDVIDVEADRKHATKRLRPLVAGAVSTRSAIALACGMLLFVFALLPRLSFAFRICLLVYFCVTLIYSLYLKKKVLLDICTLAGLYTIRVLAGGAATGIPISEWTLAFAMFCFLGLAAVKRYAELQALSPEGELLGRGYEPSDQSTVHILGLSSMMISVLVLALYLHTPEVTALYRHSDALWLMCPVMLYWFGRIWVVAGRGEMHSDPILFALRDRVSLLVAAIIIAIGLMCK